MYNSLFPIFNCGCPQYSIEGELSGNLARVVERSIPRQTFEHLQPPVLSKMAIISIYVANLFQKLSKTCKLDHNDGQFFRAMEWLMFFL